MTDSSSALHAVVTGASRGIGAAIAERLAAAGMRVSVIGRDAAALDALYAGRAEFVIRSCDLASEAEIAALFDRLGPVDVLVNNAGAAASAPFLKSDDQLFERMMAINFMAAVRCIRKALPGMIERGRGRIVNIASTAGLKGYAYVTAYAASKHAVIGLTRSLALETARRGVTVNAICPGYADTDIVREAVANIVAKTGRDASAALAEIVQGNPQGRLISPAEVAGAVAFLCSDEAASITGQSLAVAGGEIM